jgi:hypothetical protein
MLDIKLKLKYLFFNTINTTNKMDTYIGRVTISNFDSSYEIKEFLMDALIRWGMANKSDHTWTIKNNIHVLSTDQFNIALMQKNAKPTYILELYSKVPLREDGPTRYMLRETVEHIRTLFMHPDLLMHEDDDDDETLVNCSCGCSFYTTFPIETDPGCDDCPKCGATHYEKDN